MQHSIASKRIPLAGRAVRQIFYLCAILAGLMGATASRYSKACPCAVERMAPLAVSAPQIHSLSKSNRPVLRLGWNGIESVTTKQQTIHSSCNDGIIYPPPKSKATLPHLADEECFRAPLIHGATIARTIPHNNIRPNNRWLRRRLWELETASWSNPIVLPSDHLPTKALRPAVPFAMYDTIGIIFPVKRFNAFAPKHPNCGAKRKKQSLNLTRRVCAAAKRRRPPPLAR